jgi:hypothetical protein
MALPKRSRKIAVGGIDYRWAESVTIGEGGSWLNLTIESQAGSNKRIYARCPLEWDRSGNRDKIVMPKNVAAVIQYAVEDGWDPISATEDYHVTTLDSIAGDMRHPFYTASATK